MNRSSTQATGSTSGSSAPASSQLTKAQKKEEEDRLRGLSARIMHFSPSWFSVTMGTGIPTTLIFNSPYPQVVERLKPVATAILLLNVTLFCVFTLVFLTRYIRWPYIVRLTLTHPQHSLFLGTWPMSSLTCISGIITVSQAYGLGESWLWAMSVCWWITVAISAALAFTVPFLSYTTHRNVPEGITASLILPIVPLITCAAIGAVLSDHFTTIHPAYAMHMWLCSYAVLGVGILVAMMILTLYLQRLIFHHIPPNETIISSFLPLGPCGLAGFSILKLGAVAINLFPLVLVDERSGKTGVGLEMAGYALWGVGVGAAILLWALGIWFMFVACGSLWVRWREGNLPFNMGWWALVFPLASLDLSTLLIGKELNSDGFHVIGSIFTLAVVILWLAVSVPTIRGVLSGNRRVFAAPCLAQLKLAEEGDRNPNQGREAPVSTPTNGLVERGAEMIDSQVFAREGSKQGEGGMDEKALGEALDRRAGETS